MIATSSTRRIPRTPEQSDVTMSDAFDAQDQEFYDSASYPPNLLEASGLVHIAMNDIEYGATSNRRCSTNENSSAREHRLRRRKRSHRARGDLPIREQSGDHEPGRISSLSRPLERQHDAPTPHWEDEMRRLKEELDAHKIGHEDSVADYEEKVQRLKEDLFARDTTIFQQNSRLVTNADTIRALQSDVKEKSSSLAVSRADISTIQKNLKQAEAKLSTQNRQQSEAQKRTKTDCDRLSKELESAKGTIRNYESAMRSQDLNMQYFKQMYEQTAQNLQSTKSEQRTQETRIAHLTEDLEKVKKKNEQTSREADKLRSSVRTIQDNAFSSLESARWMPQTATEVSRSLTNILAEIKQWSKSYAIDEPLDFDVLESAIRGKHLILGPPELLRAVLSKKDHRMGTWLGLSSIVAATVFRRIFGTPFFAFTGEQSGEDLISISDAQGVLNVLRVVQPSDEPGANSWRCQLMRLLDPPQSNKSKEAIRMRESAASSRKAASEKLASECIQDVEAMLQGERTASEKKLGEIFHGCAELAWNLWTQRTHIRTLDIQALQKDLGHVSELQFDSESDLLEAHAQHSRDLCNDAQALDSHAVLLLVNPAIVVAGTTQGTDYQMRKIWKKAVVWMG